MLNFRWVFIETSLTLLCLLILVYSDVRLYHSLHDIQIQTKSISKRYLMVLLMAEILHHLPGMYYINPVKKWAIYDINWFSPRISQTKSTNYHFTMTGSFQFLIIVGRVSRSPNHQQLPTVTLRWTDLFGQTLLDTKAWSSWRLLETINREPRPLLHAGFLFSVDFYAEYIQTYIYIYIYVCTVKYAWIHVG